MKKDGFISMTLVYSFLIIFLFIMLAILNTYKEKNNFLEYINETIDNNLVDIRGNNVSLYNKILEDNVTMSLNSVTIGTIANKSVGNGNGLYYIDDPLVTDENGDTVGGRIYFFRGEVDDNYVVTTTIDNDGHYKDGICWRIIRTTESGEIKLIYSNKASMTNGEYTCGTYSKTGVGSKSKYNKEKNKNSYVGYMFGNPASTTYIGAHTFADENELNALLLENETFTNSSTIKLNNEDWFSKNLKSVFSILGDSVFCNDRYVNDTSTLGIGAVPTNYIEARKNNYTFVCKNNDDRFNLSIFYGGANTKVNSLSYPVGLITYDEIVYAGGSTGNDNRKYYLYNEAASWTMSPNSFNGSDAKLYYVNENGKILIDNADTEKYYYPVISIKHSVNVDSGNGKARSPYVLIGTRGE